MSSFEVLLSVQNNPNLWFQSFESLATVVGLASAGLAIALKDPIEREDGAA